MGPPVQQGKDNIRHHRQDYNIQLNQKSKQETHISHWPQARAQHEHAGSKREAGSSSSMASTPANNRSAHHPSPCTPLTATQSPQASNNKSTMQSTIHPSNSTRIQSSNSPTNHHTSNQPTSNQPTNQQTNQPPAHTGKGTHTHKHAVTSHLYVLADLN